jgi:ubiquinone/menaquinone biosynthesis C-methylase UbiE
MKAVLGTYKNPETDVQKKKSTRSHWENFWSAKKDVHEVYSNDNRVLRHVLKMTNLEGKRVLEVGAGTGRDSFGMVEHGASVFMLDYSKNSLNIIKNIATDEKVDVNPVGGNAFALPFANDSFDLVFHQGLLEHFREKEANALLKENIRVLKSGGLLLVDVPQRYHIYTVMKHILIAFDKWFAGWEREFSVRELDMLLRSLGVVPLYHYGEWMYPSLLYRVVREGLRKLGIKLPLNPTPFKPLTELRRKIRENLRNTPIVLHTSLSCGVISKKP